MQCRICGTETFIINNELGLSDIFYILLKAYSPNTTANAVRQSEAPE